MLFEKPTSHTWVSRMSQFRYLDRKALICPETAPYTGTNLQSELYRYTYGMGNYRYAAGREPYFGNSFWHTDTDLGSSIITKQNRQPSKFAVLADTVFYAGNAAYAGVGCYQFELSSFTESASAGVFLAHTGQANIAFLDGHAAAMSSGKLYPWPTRIIFQIDGNLAKLPN